MGSRGGGELRLTESRRKPSERGRLNMLEIRLRQGTSPQKPLSQASYLTRPSVEKEAAHGYG